MQFVQPVALGLPPALYLLSKYALHESLNQRITDVAQLELQALFSGSRAHMISGDRQTMQLLRIIVMGTAANWRVWARKNFNSVLKSEQHSDDRVDFF